MLSDQSSVNIDQHFEVVAVNGGEEDEGDYEQAESFKCNSKCI